MTNMQKLAEKIFNATYTECRVYIKRYGSNNTGGFGTLTRDDGVGILSTQTLNTIQKFIDNEVKRVQTDLRLGIIDASKAELQQQALDMVQKTLDNERKSNADFRKSLKSSVEQDKLTFI